jgi:uncharacterized membrane protein YgcG
MQQQLQGLRQDNQQLKQDMQQMQAEHNQAATKLTEELQATQLQVEQLRQALEQAQQQAETSKQEAAAANARAEQANARAEQATEDAEQLRRIIARSTVVVHGLAENAQLSEVQDKVAAVLTIPRDSMAYLRKAGSVHILHLSSRKVATLLLQKSKAIYHATKPAAGGKGWAVTQNLTKLERQQLQTNKERLQARVDQLKAEGARPRWHGTQLVVLMRQEQDPTRVCFKPHDQWDPSRKVQPLPPPPPLGAAGAGTGGDAAGGRGGSSRNGSSRNGGGGGSGGRGRGGGGRVGGSGGRSGGGDRGDGGRGGDTGGDTAGGAGGVSHGGGGGGGAADNNPYAVLADPAPDA